MGQSFKGSQKSPQILMDGPPFLNLHQVPLLGTSLPFKILFHEYNPDRELEASMIEQLGKNLTFKIR